MESQERHKRIMGIVGAILFLFGVILASIFIPAHATGEYGTYVDITLSKWGGGEANYEGSSHYDNQTFIVNTSFIVDKVYIKTTGGGELFSLSLLTNASPSNLIDASPNTAVTGSDPVWTAFQFNNKTLTQCTTTNNCYILMINKTNVGSGSKTYYLNPNTYPFGRMYLAGGAQTYSWEVNITGWNATAPPFAGNVTLYAPAGERYAKQNITYSYMVNSTGLTSIPCWLNVNNTITSIGNATNATQTNYSYPANIGYFGTNITCQTGAANTSSITTNFTNSWLYLNDSIFISPVYETQPNNLTTFAIYRTELTPNGFNLSYNGVNESGVTTAALGATNLYDGAYRITGTKNAPLVNANASNTTPIVWYVSAGTNTTGYDLRNQTIYWYSNITAVTATPANPLTNQNETLTATVTLYYTGNSATRSLNITFNSTVYPAVLSGSGAGYETYTAYTTLPNISTDNATVTYNASLYTAFETSAALRNSTNKTLTFYRPFLGICNTLYSTPIVNLTFYDEDTLAQTGANFQYNGTFISTTGPTWDFNGSVSNVYNYTFCIYPATASGNFNALIDYLSNTSGYSERIFYIYQTAVTAPTITNIPLALLPTSSASSNITIYMQDTGGNPLSNAYAYFYRWYPDTNTYRLVANALSSSGYPSPGIGYANLKTGQTVYYRGILQRSGQILNQLEPIYFTLGQTTYTFYSNQSTLGNYWSYYNQIASNCTPTGGLSNTLLTCTITNLGSGTLPSHFIVSLTNSLGLPNTTICQDDQTLQTAFYTCALGNITGSNYYYKLTFDSSGDTGVMAQNGWIIGETLYNSQNSQMGLFLAFILTLGLGALLALWGPGPSLVGFALGITFSQLLGLVNFELAGSGQATIILIWVVVLFLLGVLKV